jgi:hypothetical protein
LADAPLIPDKNSPGSGANLSRGRSGTKVSIHPGRLIRFLVLCLLVGLALSFFGLDALDFWRGAWSLAKGVYETMVTSIGKVASYILIGAAVLIPIWIVRVLWRRMGR